MSSELRSMESAWTDGANGGSRVEPPRQASRRTDPSAQFPLRIYLDACCVIVSLPTKRNRELYIRLGAKRPRSAF